MNLLAFCLVLVGGVLGAVTVVQSGWKSLVGWALVAISVGVIVQEVFIDWSHTVHTRPQTKRSATQSDSSKPLRAKRILRYSNGWDSSPTRG